MNNILAALRIVIFWLLIGPLASNAANRSEPTTIRVGPCPSGPAVNPLPSFNTYVEDVLPNEWPSGWGWPTEAYKAGAIAAKMYAWYHLGSPVSSNLDVYSDTHSQVYVKGSGQSSSALQYTTPATAAVRSVGMETSGGQLFLSEYWDGACDVTK